MSSCTGPPSRPGSWARACPAFRIASPHLLASVETPSPEALIGRVRDRRPPDRKATRHGVRRGVCSAPSIWRWRGGSTGPRVPVPGSRLRLSPRGNLAVWSFESGPTEEADTFGLSNEARRNARPFESAGGRSSFGRSTAAGWKSPALPAEAFAARLAGLTTTIKRALTEPARFAGVGNAYSDEILHGAPAFRPRNAPEALSSRRNWAGSTQRRKRVLTEWAAKLQAECGNAFPTSVTAFREGMAVHGRFGKPCPDVRVPGAAGAARRERDQLLRDLPDRAETAGGSGDVPAAAEEVAADAQSGRGTPATTGAFGFRAATRV